MPDERVGMDDPAMRLSHWLAGTEPPHYNPRNDVRKLLAEVVRLRKMRDAK